ncbi:MAG: DUF3261 domain-containing protein [Treponema sp.]|nr:DUF3261 domain-containing protein [Treponema sp.]
MKLHLFFPVCIVCVLSCASIAKKDKQYADVTDSPEFVLLPPGGIEQAMDMAQFLSYEFKGQNYFLNAWVKANENEIEMAFFNEFGASIGELFYRNGEAKFSSNVIPKSVIQFIKPEYILADFQLCFYDPFLLGKSLKESGLVLETKDGSRRILRGNEVIIEIEKTGNTVKLVNHLRGYTYTLEGDFNGIR